MSPHQLNNMNRMRIRIPKSWILLAVFIVSVIGAGAWVFTTPPDGKTNQTGIYFGNNSMNGVNVTADRIDVMNYFGIVVGTYLDSYSCGASYCVYHPWYAPTQVYAKNMDTGKIDYSGTDAYTVIQGANNLGSVHLRDGTYLISTPLNPVYDIIGESRNNTILKLNANNHLLSGVNTTDVTISDLTLEGNGNAFATASTLVMIERPTRVTIKNVNVFNTSEQGIVFGKYECTGGAGYGNIHDAKGSKVIDSYIDTVGINNAGCGKGLTALREDNVIFSHNHVNNVSNQAIYFVEAYGGTADTNIINNSGSGIWASYGSSYVNIINNQIYETNLIGASGGSPIGVSVAPGLCIAYPTTVGACTPSEWRNLSKNNKVVNNIIYNNGTPLNPTDGILARYGSFEASGNTIINMSRGIFVYGTKTTENMSGTMNLSDIVLKDNDILGTTVSDGIRIDTIDASAAVEPFYTYNYNIVVKNNKIRNAVGYGIYFNVTNASFDRAFFEGNIINKTTLNGIFVSTVGLVNGTGTNLVIDNNRISSPGSRGIIISAKGRIDMIDVSHNVLEYTHDGNYPIDIARNVTNISINYNTIVTTVTNGYGISVDRAASGGTTTVNSIQQNKLIGLTTNGITATNIDNTNAMIRDNWGVSPVYFGNSAGGASKPTAFGAGDMFYNTTSKAFNVWNGATWQYLNGTYVNSY